MNEWTDKIKTGDKIIVSTHARQYVCEVVRVTKTLIVVNGYGKGNVKFNKKTFKMHGFSSSSRWHATYIIECNERILADIENRDKVSRLIHKISNHDLKLLPMESLEKISEIIDAAPKKN